MWSLLLLTSTRDDYRFSASLSLVRFLQCARSQLGEKPTCPTCWKETTISSFRINPAMEEAVTAWKDARHVPSCCAITVHTGYLTHAIVCRRFVLRLANEALNVQIETSESLRPSKRRKPNSHAGDVISSLASPRSGQTGAPIVTKERLNLEIGTSDDGAEKDTRSGSEPPTSKAIPVFTGYSKLISTIAQQGGSSVECPVCAKRVPMARINNHLDSNCRSYVSHGRAVSSSRSGQRDAWSKLLDGKKSGKER